MGTACAAPDPQQQVPRPGNLQAVACSVLVDFCQLRSSRADYIELHNLSRAVAPPTHPPTHTHFLNGVLGIQWYGPAQHVYLLVRYLNACAPLSGRLFVLGSPTAAVDCCCWPPGAPLAPAAPVAAGSAAAAAGVAELVSGRSTPFDR